MHFVMNPISKILFEISIRMETEEQLGSELIGKEEDKKKTIGEIKNNTFIRKANKKNTR